MILGKTDQYEDGNVERCRSYSNSENVRGEVLNGKPVRSVIDIIDFLVYLWIGLINPYDDNETDTFLAK
jgi:hypothetical protein